MPALAAGLAHTHSRTTALPCPDPTCRRPLNLALFALGSDVFAGILGLPTVWVPRSCPACSQRAPDEHLLLPVVRKALQRVAGLFWEPGEQAAALPRHMPT